MRESAKTLLVLCLVQALAIPAWANPKDDEIASVRNLAASQANLQNKDRELTRLEGSYACPIALSGGASLLIGLAMKTGPSRLPGALMLYGVVAGIGGGIKCMNNSNIKKSLRSQIDEDRKSLMEDIAEHEVRFGNHISLDDPAVSTSNSKTIVALPSAAEAQRSESTAHGDDLSH